MINRTQLLVLLQLLLAVVLCNVSSSSSPLLSCLTSFIKLTSFPMSRRSNDLLSRSCCRCLQFSPFTTFRNEPAFNSYPCNGMIIMITGSEDRKQTGPEDPLSWSKCLEDTLIQDAVCKSAGSVMGENWLKLSGCVWRTSEKEALGLIESLIDSILSVK